MPDRRAGRYKFGREVHVMKKDKAVRKANAKAALAKRLKGLIAPALILAVIAVGVLVITFWREEEERLPLRPRSCRFLPVPAS